MTETADQTASTTAKPEPAKPKLSVRSAMTLSFLVVGGAATIGLLGFGFALGAPWIAAAVPVAAVGAGYTRHRMKNPRKPSNRTKSEGALTWPFTGNQSRRALSRLGIGSKKSAGGNKGTTGSRKTGSLKTSPTRRATTSLKRAGSLLPKTTRTRAKAGAGGALPKHMARRSPTSRTSNAKTPFAGGRPKGTRAPKTPSKTPARPATSPRLTGPKRVAGTSRKGSTPGRSSTHRRPNLRLLQGGKSSKARPSGSPGLTKKAAPSGSRKSLLGRVRPGSGSVSKTTRKLNPFVRTSPSGRHSTRRAPFRRTSSGLSTTASRRLLNGKRQVPRRSSKRPVPYKRTRARTLWRMALGLPTRNGRRLQAVTAAKRRRARRTLQLRALTRMMALRHFPAFLSSLPARFSRWHWDRIWARVPQPPKPEHEWIATAPKPKAVAAPGPRHAVPVTSHAYTGGTPAMVGPNAVIQEAFQQLASFQSQSATEMQNFILTHPDLFREIGQCYNTLADRVVSDMPFGPATSDGFRDLGAAISSIGDIAQNLYATFRIEHEAEIARLENARADERQWDTDKQ